MSIIKISRYIFFIYILPLNFLSSCKYLPCEFRWKGSDYSLFNAFSLKYSRNYTVLRKIHCYVFCGQQINDRIDFFLMQDNIFWIFSRLLPRRVWDRVGGIIRKQAFSSYAFFWLDSPGPEKECSRILSLLVKKHWRWTFSLLPSLGCCE